MMDNVVESHNGNPNQPPAAIGCSIVILVV